MPETETEDYPFIRKWGRMLRSYDYYIIGQVALARVDNAPQDAVYRRKDGTWATVDDVESDWCRTELGLSAASR